MGIGNSYRVSKITMLRLYNSYQQFSIFKNFRYSFVRFPLNQLKRIIRSKSMFWIEKLICIYIIQNRAQNNFSCQHFSVDIIWKVWWHTHFIFYKSLVQDSRNNSFVKTLVVIFYTENFVKTIEKNTTQVYYIPIQVTIWNIYILYIDLKEKKRIHSNFSILV